MTTSELDDLFNAEGGGDFLEEEGKFSFDVTKAESTESQGGDPMLKLTMKVAEGPQSGKTQIQRLTYKSDGSEAGKSIVQRSLVALGITREVAAEIVKGVPAGSQIAHLFIEAARRLSAAAQQNTPQRVVADCSRQGGTGAYADRVQVDYDLKPYTGKVATPPPTPPSPAAAAPTTPEVAGVSVGAGGDFADDAPPF